MAVCFILIIIIVFYPKKTHFSYKNLLSSVDLKHLKIYDKVHINNANKPIKIWFLQGSLCYETQKWSHSTKRVSYMPAHANVFTSMQNKD